MGSPSLLEHITSCSSGHQTGRGGSGSGLYIREFAAKVDEQVYESTRKGSDSSGSSTRKQPFQGLRIYVNGYTSGTSRSEITRLVTMHGGINLYVFLTGLLACCRLSTIVAALLVLRRT